MDSSQFQHRLRDADDAYERGDFRRALELYHQALTINPRAAAAWHGAGLSLWALGSVEDALKAFNQALQHDAKQTLVLLDKAALLTDELGEHRSALRWCDKLLMKPLPPADAADARFIAARAHSRLGNVAAAMEMLEQVLELRPRDLETLLWKGHVQFETGDYEAARQTFEAALQVEPDDAQSHFDYGLVLERLGETRAAEAEFQRAHDLDAKAYPLPLSVSENELERIAARTLQALPPEFRDAVRDVPILLEDFPSRELVRKEPGISPQVLGLFTGNIHQYRFVGGPHPTAIILYRKNLEKLARTSKELEREIRITLLHEIAHYLGFDEEDMEELGL
jgi:predicted Zn-dependent protease with MMP-like domain/Flp pilus assembly protein TadD